MTQLTVKEMAALERVDERTVRRWIAKGAVDVRRTPGGGIRILSSEKSRLAVLSMANPDIFGHSAK